MIVLDASVLIAHFATRDQHRRAAFEILDTEEDLAIHPLHLAETLVQPARDGTEVHVRGQIAALGIEQLVPIDDEPFELARLRAATGLKLPDCCALACAERTGAALATFDLRLGAAARARAIEVLGS